MSDELGEAMGQVRRDVEAAVRIPPYELVLRRHHRRQRRRVGVGGLALAVLVAVGLVVAPGLVGGRTGAVAPSSHMVSVSVAPITGKGTLSVQDVSFATARVGTVLGRRCAQTCHDVTLASTDGGEHYGPEVPVPGNHGYVAATADGRQVAYGPDLAISTDYGQTWAPLATPAPVADIAVTGGQLLVLLVPTGGQAQLWSGPLAAASWSAYAQIGDGVPGSDDTARLSRPADGAVIVVSAGPGRAPTVTTGDLEAGGAVAWQTRPVGACGQGSRPNLSALSVSTWWVACAGQRGPAGGEAVALTTYAGESYTDAGPPAAASTATAQRVTATTADVAYLSGPGGLLVTRDGGQSWRTLLTQPGLGDPHIPPGTGGTDIWVVAPGTSTVYRSGGGAFSGLRLR